MKIVTTHVYPPIPVRCFDWSAIDEDTYDGEKDDVGYGRTEAEAVQALMDLIQEKKEELQ